jgi:uncharacterized membrane protein
MAGTATLESGRSVRPLFIASLILSILGIGVAGYLTYVHYADISPICAGGSGGCEKVQASDQSKLVGIPVALLGLLTYVTLLVLNILRGDLARTGAALVAIVGFGFSAYLTIESVTVIKATCQWCLSSLAIMTLMAIVTAARLVRGDRRSTLVRRRGGARLWQTGAALGGADPRRHASDPSTTSPPDRHRRRLAGRRRATPGGRARRGHRT